MTKEEYFGKWLKVIGEKELNEVVRKINSLYEHQSVMPAYEDIFKAFNLCDYDNLKVVFIGQDPYPQRGVATGILFGNNYDKVVRGGMSPSLEVVEKACVDFSLPHSHIEFDYSLESWAKQGILMINSALTVLQDAPNSHTMLWRPFMCKLLKNLSIHETGIIYVLFGTQAQTLKPYINSKLNHILEVKHPAYYARVGENMPTSLFTHINRILINKYGKPIIWYEEHNV